MSATTPPTANGRYRLRDKLTASAAVISAMVLVPSLFVDMGNPSRQEGWRWTVGVTLVAVALTGAILVFGRRQMRPVFRAPLTGLFYGLVTAIITGGALAAVEWFMTWRPRPWTDGLPPTNSLHAAVLAGLPAGAVIGVGIGLIAWAVFRLVPHRATGSDEGQRPRFQFGLRTLLFAVLVVALLLWVGMPAQRNYQHQRAVSQLLESGAQIEFEGENTEDWFESLTGVHLARQWYANVRSVTLGPGTTDDDLRQLDYVPEVRGLLLDCTLLTDAGLARLERLKALELVHLDYPYLYEPPTTGEGFEALARLPQLNDVSIHKGVLNDAALARLMSPPKLRSVALVNVTFTGSGLSAVPPTRIPHLRLVGVNVRDADLDHLSRFADVENLMLSGTSVSDAGLASLSQMKTLRHLRLGGAGLTGKGLAHLSALPNLESLALDALSIRDDDLRSLTPLAHLEVISISGTLITDAALPHLEALPALRQVWMYGTWVTQPGADRLRDILQARDPPGTVHGTFQPGGKSR